MIIYHSLFPDSEHTDALMKAGVDSQLISYYFIRKFKLTGQQFRKYCRKGVIQDGKNKQRTTGESAGSGKTRR